MVTPKQPIQALHSLEHTSRGVSTFNMHYGVIILNTVFCVGFLVQFGKLLHDTVTSTELYTEMKKVDGTTKPFPLELSICVTQPTMNKTALQVKNIFIVNSKLIPSPLDTNF